MKPFDPKMQCALAPVIGGILAAGPAMAEKPAWAGGGKGGKNQKNEQMDRRGEQSGAWRPTFR